MDLKPEAKPNSMRYLREAAADYTEAEERLASNVRNARRCGNSWEEIGQALGVSKQTAYNRYGKRTAPEPSKILEPDVAGDSVTPSIFLDPIAPAKPKTTSKKVDHKAPAKQQFPNNPELWPWIHAITADTDKHEQDPTYPAQPGTGKGPHACPSCGQTNHHGYARSIKFLADCTPTKYDPPATVDTMNEWKASK